MYTGIHNEKVELGDESYKNCEFDKSKERDVLGK